MIDGGIVDGDIEHLFCSKSFYSSIHLWKMGKIFLLLKVDYGIPNIRFLIKYLQFNLALALG